MSACSPVSLATYFSSLITNTLPSPQVTIWPPAPYCKGIKYKWHAYKKIPMEPQFLCLIELLASGWKYCSGHAQRTANKPNHRFMLHTYVHILLLLGIISSHYYIYSFYLSQESVKLHSIYTESNKMQFCYIANTHYYNLLHVLALSGPSSGRQIQEIYTTVVYIIIKKCKLCMYKTYQHAKHVRVKYWLKLAELKFKKVFNIYLKNCNTI
jgi:hypothetical protein